MTRLSAKEAIQFLSNTDIYELGTLANSIRTRLHNNKTYYVKNFHLNYTNICVHSCKFCGFARRKGESGGWQMTIDSILEYIGNHGGSTLSEVHIVGGLNPEYKFDFYTEMVNQIRQNFPNLHIKAFTATEIDFISKISKKTIDETLKSLIEAGLNSMPGGGAEIFSKRVWDTVCDHKTAPDQWLQVHRTAHKLGLKSTCTMLYGHIETHAEIVEHMNLLRKLQDETGGFTAFIPLAFQPYDNQLSHLNQVSALESIKVHALARVFFDNIEHIKAYWVTLGLRLAQILMDFGVDDIDGTIVEERIMHMSGANSPKGLTEESLIRHIKESGKTPVQRDTLYNPVKIWN
ncbi:MAG: aminofutalosine synthase MqnE [Planctomycetes bacterium]|nr:aminofutalosine synthase MqnE [Planctomycetota bacterium]